MRSLLVAQADDQQLAQALTSGAHAVVVDLNGAAPDERTKSRAATTRFLKYAHAKRDGPVLIVRANRLDSGETDSDLDAVMAGAPDAIMLPGSLGAASIQRLSVKLAVREAMFALPDGRTRIIAVADSAQSLLSMGSYRGSSARLLGIAWSAQALRADLGTEADRDRLGDYLGPYRLARELVLLAATSARVAAIDAAFPDLGDKEGLRAEVLAARRDGFAGKMALNPTQAEIINDIFVSQSTPLAKGGQA